jgi:plasmid stabilization system protein ParE
VAHSVVFAPEVEADLIALCDDIAAQGGPERALGYVERIVAACRNSPHAARAATTSAPGCG